MEGAPLRILIADDVASNRQVLALMLSPYGSCTQVVNGAQAIEEWKAKLSGGEPYDLLCLDVLMPELSGTEVIEQIRRAESEQALAPSKFLLVSMLSARRVAAEFKGDAATAVLTKPVMQVQLAAAMRQLGFTAD